MFLPDVFSGNKNLHMRLGGEIAYRSWRILAMDIELMRFYGERRQCSCARQCGDEQNINHT